MLNNLLSSNGDISHEPPSQSQHVFDLLKEKISMMELPPGRRLSEADLLAQLGVGRTPFREAIQRLVQHGLVISKPYQSPVVAPLEAVEVAQIVELRTLLEIASARAAAERATPKEREAIHTANAVYNDSIDTNDKSAIIHADGALHDAIAGASHNAHLRQVISWNRDFGCRLWVIAVDRGGQVNTRKYAHDALVTAISDGDPNAAEHEMRSHIGLFRNRLLRLLNGDPVSEPGRSVQGGVDPQ